MDIIYDNNRMPLLRCTLTTQKNTQLKNTSKYIKREKDEESREKHRIKQEMNKLWL